jgi:hypothetical protein
MKFFTYPSIIFSFHKITSCENHKIRIFLALCTGKSIYYLDHTFTINHNEETPWPTKFFA